VRKPYVSNDFRAVMIMSNEIIYYIGLAMVGLSLLLAIIFIPVLLLTGSRIRNQLEDDYGKTDHHGKH